MVIDKMNCCLLEYARDDSLMKKMIVRCLIVFEITNK